MRITYTGLMKIAADAYQLAQNSSQEVNLLKRMGKLRPGSGPDKTLPNEQTRRQWLSTPINEQHEKYEYKKPYDYKKPAEGSYYEYSQDSSEDSLLEDPIVVDPAHNSPVTNYHTFRRFHGESPTDQEMDEMRAISRIKRDGYLHGDTKEWTKQRVEQLKKSPRVEKIQNHVVSRMQPPQNRYV